MSDPSTIRGRLLAPALLASLGLLACGGETRRAEPTPEPEEHLTVSDFRPDLDVERGESKTVSDKVVSADELPEAHRELLEAWKMGGLVWNVHRGEVLADSELTTFLVDNLLLLIFQEHRSIQGMAATEEVGESLAARRAAYVRARTELRLLGAPAAEALAEAMAIGDDVLFTLVHDILGEMGADGAPAVVPLLERPSALTRYRAASVLGRLPHGGMREGEVQAALRRAAAEDDSEIVRVQATRSVGERALWSMAGRDLADVDLTPARLTLEACLDDAAEAVRLEALAGLDLLGDARAVEALVAYGERVEREGRAKELSRAGGTVRGLTGQDLGVDPATWASWWKNNGEDL